MISVSMVFVTHNTSLRHSFRHIFLCHFEHTAQIQGILPLQC